MESQTYVGQNEVHKIVQGEELKSETENRDVVKYHPLYMVCNVLEAGRVWTKETPIDRTKIKIIGHLFGNMQLVL